MSVPASAPIGPRRGGTPRSRALVVTIAIIVTLAVVVSGSAVVLLYSKVPVSSRQVLAVGHGRSSLAVPLMTMYTAPKIPNAQVESSANWSVASTRTGPSTTYLFQWSLLTHLSIPVRFVLNATTEDQNFGAFALGSTADGFAYYPAGTCSGGCNSTGKVFGASGAGIHDVLYQTWRMDYTVRRITDGIGPTQTSYLEVEFALSPQRMIGIVLPAANVTPPGPGDVLDASDILHLPAYGQVTTSSHGTHSPPDFFRNTVGTVAFDAGPEGTVTAQLTSRFRWSTVDDYVLSFRASKETWIRYLFDLRFGSLLIEYVPPLP